MSAAARQRRRTERKRTGALCVTVEISRELRDELIDAGRLRAWDEDSREVVRALMQEIINGLRIARHHA